MPDYFVLETALVDSLVPNQVRIWQFTNQLTNLRKVNLSGPFYLPAERPQGEQQFPALQVLVRLLQPRRPEIIAAVGEDTGQGASWWLLDHGTVEGQIESSSFLEQLNSIGSPWEQVQMGKNLTVLEHLPNGRQLVQEVNEQTYFVREYHHSFIAELDPINRLDLYSKGVTVKQQNSDA